MSPLRRMRGIVIIAMIAAPLVGGCSSGRAQLSIYNEEDRRLIYASDRSARCDCREGSVAFILAPVRRGGVLYEPYPVYLDFARIVGETETDTASPTAGKVVFIIRRGEREAYRIRSSHVDHGQPGRVQARIEASDGERRLWMFLEGRTVDDADALWREVRVLLAEASPNRDP